LTISRSLIVAVTLTFLCAPWVDCRSIILNSMNVLVPQIWFYTTHAVLNLVGRHPGGETVALKACVGDVLHRVAHQRLGIPVDDPTLYHARPEFEADDDRRARTSHEPRRDRKAGPMHRGARLPRAG